MDKEGRTTYGQVGKIKGGGLLRIMYPEQNLVIAYACIVTSNTDDLPVFKIANLFLPKDPAENKTQE